MQTHTITGGDGIQLHVVEAGNPEGKSILFIHGYSQCRLAWSKQMDSELAAEFRLVAMDIRGHGLSDKPRDAYGESQLWADDVNAVITTLGLEQPLLAGWSYGGAIICNYLHHYGEEGIGGINLIGATSKLGPPVMPFLGAEFIALVPGFFSNDVQESATALETFMHLCLYEAPSPADLYLMLGYNTIVPPYVRQALFSREMTCDDLLSSLQKPVLITHGEADQVVLPKLGHLHASLINHAKASFYPNVGHAPFWEDSQRFNRELAEFVRAL